MGHIFRCIHGLFEFLVLVLGPELRLLELELNPSLRPSGLGFISMTCVRAFVLLFITCSLFGSAFPSQGLWHHMIVTRVFFVF